ncbi:MAG TPA: EAL domain-containing protein [Polyangia bacterium]|jgi:EAL domain-containing protein (putative c-di-GMP-specific phosphodiesterase class I)/CheY-like chemotaxis protein|nr:EAL domain-containing protein [Polyangia bacterium]
MQARATVAPANGHGSPAGRELSAPEILVVDDEPVTARGYARALAAGGYKVAVAHDGREAAALAKGRQFDAIVSDIAMPDMDGLALLRVIRETDLDVPMIFMTGSPALESAMAAIEYGAFRYLVKPVASDALIDAVARAVMVHKLARIRREAVAVHELEGRPIGDRAGLEARFTSAVDKLWVAAQPIVSWSGRSIFAYETLLRTDEPTLRSPLDFFDAAERLGRAGELGRIIRQHVARILRETPPPAHLFVNLHPADLEDDELYADDGALTPYAKQVVLEITERAALDQIHELGSRVTRLRALGYRIAIDDLGAGYAGLTSFAQLEPEVVKVDMSLVRGIDSSAVKQKLVRSIIALCTELGIQLVAEGIETAAERDALIALGGDLCQGYLFARPGRGYPEPDLS